MQGDQYALLGPALSSLPSLPSLPLSKHISPLLDQASSSFPESALPVDVVRKPVPSLSIEKVTRPCQCCFDQFESEQLIRCRFHSEHRFCFSCVRDFIHNCINEKKNVICLAGCSCSFPEIEIAKVLDEKNLHKYRDHMLTITVYQQAGKTPSFNICPFCEKYGKVSKTKEEIKCSFCEKSWCSSCREEAHLRNPCGLIKKTDPLLISRVVDQILNKSILHSCPCCNLKYIKSEGCNLIHCTSCKACSCYLCGIEVKPRDNIYYWHFKNSGSAAPDAKCPVYGGENLLINKQVKQEIRDLLEVNKDNKEICKMIEREVKMKLKEKSECIIL